jgi:hypothetical protein
MPSRTDKRDALTLAAYLTGIEIEFIDGPNGSLISAKAAPPVCARRPYTCIPSNLTCPEMEL